MHGSLVAPEHVEAAHCVITVRATHHFEDTIHFLGGARSKTKAIRATCLHFLEAMIHQPSQPDRRCEAEMPLGALNSTRRFIVLNDKLAVVGGPRTSGGAAEMFGDVAYPRSALRLSAHHNSLAPDPEGARLWFNGCDTHPAVPEAGFLRRTAAQ